MQTFENDRIRVTVSDEVVTGYLNRSVYVARIQGTQTPEQIMRGLILSDAMSILGNRSEFANLEREPITDREIEAAAIELIIYEYLTEHCRYNLGETIMRMNGGHRMSEGMSSDVSAARAYALNELINNRESSMSEGRKSLELRRYHELRYRRVRSNDSEFTIEIIGEMPDTIGMCRVEVAS